MIWLAAKGFGGARGLRGRRCGPGGWLESEGWCRTDACDVGRRGAAAGWWDLVSGGKLVQFDDAELRHPVHKLRPAVSRRVVQAGEAVDGAGLVLRCARSLHCRR